MPKEWIKFGALCMTVRYVEWRKGLAYFRRRIPQDLQKYYPGNSKQIFVSLKTRDPQEAAKRAHAKALQQDQQWAHLRAGGGQTAEVRAAAHAILQKHQLEPGTSHEWAKIDVSPDFFLDELERFGDEEGQIQRENLPPEFALAADLFYADKDQLTKLLTPLLSEVKEKHFYFKPSLRDDPQFKLAFDEFVSLNGDLPVDQYKREHGNRYVKALVDRRLSKATVERYLTQVRPIFATAITELEVPMNNPLASLKIPEVGTKEAGVRLPFTVPQIHAIQKKCREVDDERRWLLAILSDTGARLAEVAGLLRDEVILDQDVPYITLKPNKLRRLKTDASARKVPLVGEALWAATRAMECGKGAYLFPTIVKAGELNSNSVSAALNKWLSDNALRNQGQSVHSFRHAIRDRLRNAGALPDVADRIGGWKRQGVGEGYGQGHDLGVLHEAMKKVVEGKA